jgi:uncharacterized membrane protein/4-amino-4-deoxy-L-arabinose transferase-like glycosyltransferase
MPRSLVALLLVLVLALGALFRLTGLNWDANQHLHPDERFLTMVVAAERWPSSVRDYLDETRSPLNPRNVGFAYFAYGTLPTTLVRGAGTLLGISDLDRLALVGRSLSAIADLGSVLLLFLVALRLYEDVRIALLGSLLFASSVLPIQHAHFFVVDPYAVLFVMASMWALVHGPEWGSRAYVASGIFLGLGLACKLSVATFAVVIAAAAWADGERRPVDRDLWLHRLTVWGWREALAGVAALVALRVAQPDAFAGSWLFDLVPSRRWLADLVETRHLLNGDIDFPPGIQWANRTPLWFPWKNLVVWGMGPFLGVAAWAGWSLAAWRLVARGDRRQLIPVLWVAVGFLQVGTQFVMAGRYLLPIYPSLALLAAWLLVGLLDRPHLRRVAFGAGALTVAATLAWAVAFTAIYRRPNTRVAASRWIYQNVPAGSRLATEHWDDRLPLRLGSLRPDRYPSVELTNFDDDTPEKLASLVDKLDAADYVILSSNRLSASIPRLPMRYPMTTKYYHLLLSGELGFRRVGEFTSYPRLGRLQFPDQSAEEAFSVYDHPRVEIFQKTAAWSAERARTRLDVADWDDVMRVAPRDARRFKNGLMLPAAEWNLVRSGAAWPWRAASSGWANRWPVLAWILALEGIGLAAFPIAALVFDQLPDRGWLLSKSVGLLLIGYLAWVTASLRWMSFGTTSLVAALVVLAACSSTVIWVRRAEFARFWRARRRLLVAGEGLFLTCFVAFLIVRAGNPDLWHPFFGGEKPMDFAYLNAVIRTAHFPPYDPWFAGGYINYYYFGFVLAGALARLSGVVPRVAYNLAVPTFAAMAAAAAFSVAYALADAIDAGPVRRWWTKPFALATLAVVFVMGLGNLGEVSVIAQALAAGSWRQIPVWSWYWNATRIIPHAANEAPPITEFPFFTTLYGDLHAHLLALPYTMLVLALAAGIVMRPLRRSVERWREGLVLGALGLTIGALYATNAWDSPTYLLIVACAFGLRAWMDLAGSGRVRDAALSAGWRLLAVAAAGRLLFAPFFAHFSEPAGGLELWTGSRTTPAAYLTIHGFFLFIILSSATCSWMASRAAVHRRQVEPARRFLALLVVVSLLLSLVVELVKVTNDVGRMNTVFKAYFEIWVLLGIAAAVSLAPLADAWRRRPVPLRGRGSALVSSAWVLTGTLLFLGCAAYVPLATRARWHDRFDRRVGFTLDGQAYMKSAVHEELGRPFGLEPDLEAIRWLESEPSGAPVVVEGHQADYRWGGRISANTGLPTILGWSGHERQQRAVLPGDVTARRVRDIAVIYTSTDTDRVAGLLQRYQADLVYVGPLERILYPSAGLAKFDADSRHWRRVYSKDGAAIYQVVR